MSRFGLVATGTDSWMLLRAPGSELSPKVKSDLENITSNSESQRTVANLRKTSVHPELWFFQGVGDPHMVPIIAEDHYMACKKYLLQIEESEIRKEDLTMF